MRNRLNQVTCLAILVGASSLIGCATKVPTTRQWGASQSFQQVNLKGKEYFCRPEPTNALSSSTNVNCLTSLQLLNFRIASERTSSRDLPIVAFTYPTE